MQSIVLATFLFSCLHIVNSATTTESTSVSKLPVSKFPFLWGTATAAYQIEGAIAEDGKGPSIWDSFALLPNKVFHNDTGEIGTDSYHQYKKDIAIMKEMGVTAHRFSISWPRILPQGNGEINYAGIHHYNLFIDELLKNGIEPMVTLYHWDLPENLEKTYKGWLNKQIVKDFARYSDVCFQAFGDRVKYWMTINEPWTFAFFGYAAGSFAPGRCSDRSKCPEGDSNTECYIVAHNVILAHAAAVKVYRNKYLSKQQGQIGMVLNHDWAEPLTDSPLDKAAAERKNIFAMGWFADPIVFGAYPKLMVDMLGDRLPKFTKDESEMIKGSFDFWGLNHYSSKYVSHPIPDKIHTEFEGGWDVDMNIAASTVSKDGAMIGAQSDSTWLQVVPWGFYKVIKWNHDRYATAYATTAANNNHFKNKNFNFIITENGCDVPEESDLPLQMALQDDFRINYYAGYIREMERAMGEGVDIRGYMAWSLLDNFEWADGYNFRFGMIYVDFDSPNRTRYPKASSRWYSDYVQSHANYIVNYETKTVEAYSADQVKVMEEYWQEQLDKEIEKEEEKEKEKEKDDKKNSNNNGSNNNNNNNKGIRNDDDDDDDRHHKSTKSSSSSSLRHSFFRENGDLDIAAFYTSQGVKDDNIEAVLRSVSPFDQLTSTMTTTTTTAENQGSDKGVVSTSNTEVKNNHGWFNWNSANDVNNQEDTTANVKINKYKKHTFFNYFFSWLSQSWMQSWQLAQMAPFRQQPQYFT